MSECETPVGVDLSIASADESSHCIDLVNQKQGDIEKHHCRLKEKKLANLVDNRMTRSCQFVAEGAGLYLDFSKNILDEACFETLVEYAELSSLQQKISDMFSGKRLNLSEDRPVLHTLLRHPISEKDILPPALEHYFSAVHEALAMMSNLCDQIRSGAWCSHNGKSITQVVNIGVGGSYLGIKTALDALMPYSNRKIEPFFLCSVDPAQWIALREKIDPDRVLFLISSKSFSTLETLLNAQQAKAWMLEKGVAEADLNKHFITITAHPEKVKSFGIAEMKVLPVWDWVGGRYSVWSSIGFMIVLVLGFEVFMRMLSGARAMDKHFFSVPFRKNLPVILGLLGIWYHNYFKAESHLILVYSQLLRGLPQHLQQLDMESNGKRVNLKGKLLSYTTAPIVWGGVGTESQHSFHQLLHQGTRMAPVDFILPLQVNDEVIHKGGQAINELEKQKLQQMQKWLVSHGLAQSQVLMHGQSFKQAYEKLSHNFPQLSQDALCYQARCRVIPGGKPSNIILFNQLTPETLGALMALYEHKVMVQGVLWQINSFDQWGVEQGKQLGEKNFDYFSGEGKIEDEAFSDILQYCKQVYESERS